MTRTTRIVLFAIVGGVGLFIIGAYAGVYYWPPIRRCRAIFCDPYHWQVLAIGIAFFCAGLAYVIPEKWRIVGTLNALLLLAALLSGIIGSFAAR
jgi:hypothetical protein